ncbi:peptidase M17 [Shewanella mangrovi]|uniref:Peptidase M17 n=1 Tax=Shewanella mangrovi TaxID=1515746 RepID=A0A094JAV8_9GAMM|nr:peptidase M17 [Shewanella mangrovi]KFZ37050.1 peptidase M17 [Shewanella mangrovi]
MPQFISVSSDELFASSNDWDALIIISPDPLAVPFAAIRQALQQQAAIDKRIGQQLVLSVCDSAPGNRLLSAVVQIDAEYGDVSVYAEVAQQAIAQAQASGAKRPLLWVAANPLPQFAMALSVAALGCAQQLWLPLEAREAGHQVGISCIGLVDVPDNIAVQLTAIEAGRILARDLCATEPERMAPYAFVDYCMKSLVESDVDVSVLDDLDTLLADYPLLCAVGRASLQVERHQPRVLQLEYLPEDEVKHTLLLAGKGVIFDTGGASLKVGGGMSGMSRDKGGAAAIAGLMKTIGLLKPQGVRVVAQLGLVRNSIGSDAFVPDEIITSHAGTRVRIGNTDAEGRLVLADLLSHLRILASDAVNPQLFSVATLTSHAARAFGRHFATVPNSVALANLAPSFSHQANLQGEAATVSALSQEDFSIITDTTLAADVLSSMHLGSSMVTRGHQLAAAFIVSASGLNRHGAQSPTPLPFMHLDIAGAAIEGDPRYGKPNAIPLVTFWHYLQQLI